jgi:glyoxylase-like metal-dependent hydrolase (beta-lactamase superfamily II)
VAIIPPTLHPIRGLVGCCHLLEAGDESVMIDTGLVGEPMLLRRLLARLRLRPGSIKAILLTHGHLDHTGNLAWLTKWTGAKVFALREETLHVAGQYPYTGVARWCGRMEAVGRFLLRHRAGRIDEFIADGQELPFWGGLRVIHLPGHTAGHCGFFSARHNLLFSGDMFASFFFKTHKPPAIWNSAPEFFSESVAKIRRLAPRMMVPSHYDFLDGELHRRRFCHVFGLSDWVTAITSSNPPASASRT